MSCSWPHMFAPLTPSQHINLGTGWLCICLYIATQAHAGGLQTGTRAKKKKKTVRTDECVELMMKKKRKKNPAKFGRADPP